MIVLSLPLPTCQNVRKLCSKLSHLFLNSLSFTPHVLLLTDTWLTQPAGLINLADVVVEF